MFKRCYIVIWLLLSFLISSIAAHGQAGSEGPELIHNIAQLQEIAKNPRGVYALAGDIDATETRQWNDGKGFQPIPNFSGVFDGRGYTIKGLVIDRPDEQEVGLFKVINGDGVVRNVGLEDVAIVGNSFVGAITGRNLGEITGSYSTGYVVGGHRNVGGIAGRNRGVITDSYSSAQVIGNDRWTGGITGFNDGEHSRIERSYATGPISNNGGYIGGVAGVNQGLIANAYATGSVKSESTAAGGVVGMNTGTIQMTYSTGAVSGVGRLVGGVVGNASTGEVISSFWNVTSSGVTESAAGEGITATQMSSRTFWEEDPIWNSQPRWDIDFSGDQDAVWRLLDGQNAPELNLR